MTEQELNKRFSHHPPTSTKMAIHAEVRKRFRALADAVNLLPEGREQSLAITALEESMFWANAAVARNEICNDPGTDPNPFLKSESNHSDR